VRKGRRRGTFSRLGARFCFRIFVHITRLKQTAKRAKNQARFCLIPLRSAGVPPRTFGLHRGAAAATSRTVILAMCDD